MINNVLVTIDVTGKDVFVGKVDGKDVIRYVAKTGSLKDLTASDTAAESLRNRVQFKEVPRVKVPMTTKEAAKFLNLTVDSFKKFARRNGVGSSGRHGIEATYSIDDMNKLMVIKDSK